MFGDGMTDSVNFENGWNATTISIRNNDKALACDPNSQGLKIKVFRVFMILE